MKATPCTVIAMVGLSVAMAGSAWAQDAQTTRAAGAPSAATSFQLIDKALAARTIDTVTAHRFRVFAAFADSRLPAAYRGDDSGMPALPPSVAAVGQLLETFAPATRAELAPFFMRPAEPGSWTTLSTVPGQEPAPGRGGGDSGPALTDAESAQVPAPTTWKSVSAVGGKAKVWAQDRYPGDDAIAQGLASALTSLIWDKLTVLMQQEPYPDNGVISNGGDGALDFYLVHLPSSWNGLTSSSIPGAPCHPATYIMIDTGRNGLGSATSYGVLQIAVHELMHAIVAAYRVRGGCPNAWINEASAEWASNWVYPRTDEEHKFAKTYLMDVEHQLTTDFMNTDRAYGEYLLPYYLEMSGGGPAFMPKMWTNFKTMDVLQGVDSVMPGGWKKSWPLFLLQLWNRPPVDAPDGFKAWDRLATGATPWGVLTDVKVTSGITKLKMEFLPENPAQFVFESGVQPLGGHFRHFKIDNSVKQMVFTNTIHEEGLVNGTVWIIEKIRRAWQTPVDLTEEFEKSWCRSLPKEDIEELVIVFGNHDWKNLKAVNPAEEPTLEAYPTGCKGWTGTITTTIKAKSIDPAYTIDETTRATMEFLPDSTLITPGAPIEYFKVVSGNLSWSATVSGTCKGTAIRGFAITDLGGGAELAVLRVWEEDGRIRHRGSGGPWPGDVPFYSVGCPDGPAKLAALGWGNGLNTDLTKDSVAADGKSFRGDHFVAPSPQLSIRWRYKFRCVGC